MTTTLTHQADIIAEHKSTMEESCTAIHHFLRDAIRVESMTGTGFKWLEARTVERFTFDTSEAHEFPARLICEFTEMYEARWTLDVTVELIEIPTKANGFVATYGVREDK